MSKRKPPSQRSERQMDDTAKAIARLREDEKPDRAAESERAEGLRPTQGHSEHGVGPRKAGGLAPPAGRRRKTV